MASLLDKLLDIFGLIPFTSLAKLAKFREIWLSYQKLKKITKRKKAKKTIEKSRKNLEVTENLLKDAKKKIDDIRKQGIKSGKEWKEAHSQRNTWTKATQKHKKDLEILESFWSNILELAAEIVLPAALIGCISNIFGIKINPFSESVASNSDLLGNLNGSVYGLNHIYIA